MHGKAPLRSLTCTSMERAGRFTPSSSAFRRKAANGTNRRARIRDALTWRQ